ncbi:MAG: MauE/DoxX family redox-associated membrane protein [Desulfohalobiaceae bacterium]
MSWFFLCLRIAFGLVFVYASLGKIADPATFALLISRYQLLPPELVNLTALVLPWMEAVCGLALILGIFPRGAALVLALLMLVFINALAVNLVRGVDVSCGCFDMDPEAEANMLQAALRDAGLMLMAVVVLVREHFLYKSKKSGSRVRLDR